MKRIKNLKDGVVGLIGLALIVGIPGTYVFTYGNHWRFGDKYFMPKTIVDETGWRYPDGKPIDMLTLATLENEEEVWLVCLSVIAAVLGFVWFISRQLHREIAARRKEMGLCAKPSASG